MSSAPAVDVPAGNARERKAAKGRRRRAAAEQRRIEQQRWGKYLGEDDEDFSLVQPSPPVSAGVARRRRRRNERLSLPVAEDLLELDDPDLAFSLALSLSISEGNDLSYESLVQLENVSCVASAATVAALPMCVFVKEEINLNADVCVICQSEYDQGDSQVRLPCLHNFHHACGSEWLLKYSRLCPVCKHEVADPSSL
jgi:hypothetical protein